MTEQIKFVRRYQLIVGKPAKRTLNINARDSFRSDEIDREIDRAESSNTIGTVSPFVAKSLPQELVQESIIGNDDFLEITNLHIEAEVIKSKAKDGKETVPAMIRVYNASPDTRSRLEAGNIVLLKAGYLQNVDSEGNLPRLFLGTIFQAETQKQGTNVVTTIYAHNAFEPRKFLRVSKSWNPPTTYAEVMDDVVSIIRAAGVTVNLRKPESFNSRPPLASAANDLAPEFNSTLAQRISTTYNQVTARKGEYLYGDVWEFLKKICDAIRYRYYFIDNILYIEPLFIPPEARVKTYFVKPSDIRGSVKKKSKAGLYGVPGTSVEGVMLNLFLTPEIQASERISMNEVFDEYNDYSGTYQVVGVKHVLQFEGQDWYTEVEAQRISDAT